MIRKWLQTTLAKPSVASRPCAHCYPSSTLKNLVNPWPISLSFSSSAGDSFLQFSSQQDAPNIALEFSLFISKTAFHAVTKHNMSIFHLATAIGQEWTGMKYLVFAVWMDTLPTITCCCLQHRGNAVDTSGTCLPISLFPLWLPQTPNKAPVNLFMNTYHRVSTATYWIKECMKMAVNLWPFLLFQFTLVNF